MTSCGDIEQNLILNADGSGSLETSFDVGEMMSMMKGMGDMGNLTNEDVTISADQPADTTMVKVAEPKDPMQAIIDKVTDPAYGHDFDTLMSFISIMPDSVKAKRNRMDLANKIFMRMKSPANSSSLMMGVVMNFDNKAQLAKWSNMWRRWTIVQSNAFMPVSVVEECNQKPSWSLMQI